MPSRLQFPRHDPTPARLELGCFKIRGAGDVGEGLGTEDFPELGAESLHGTQDGLRPRGLFCVQLSGRSYPAPNPREKKVLLSRLGGGEGGGREVERRLRPAPKRRGGEEEGTGLGGIVGEGGMWEGSRGRGRNERAGGERGVSLPWTSTFFVSPRTELQDQDSSPSRYGPRSATGRGSHAARGRKESCGWRMVEGPGKRGDVG